MLVVADGTYNTSGDVEKDFEAAKKKQKMTSMSHTERLLRMVWPSLSNSEGLGWIVSMAGLVVAQTWLMGKVSTTHSALNAMGSISVNCKGSVRRGVTMECPCTTRITKTMTGGSVRI